MMPPARDEAFLAELSRFLRSRTGLSFPAARFEDLAAGAARAMERAGITEARSYRASLEGGGRLFDDLVEELTVGETYFLRDPGQFEFVRSRVLPAYRATHPAGSVFRAWSAGCASGEEPYTLAIALREEGMAPFYLLASDLSKSALAKARAALYPPWSLRNAEPLFVDRYFLRSGTRFRLDEEVRRTVTFSSLNLAMNVFPSLLTGTWGMDLILCRNVLIYFDGETIRRVVGRLFASLAPGGWLVTAPSDPPLGPMAPLQPVVAPTGVYYRREGEAPSIGIGPPTPLSPPEEAEGRPPGFGPEPGVEPPPTFPRRDLPRSSVEPPPTPDPLGEAEGLFARGAYDEVLRRTRSFPARPESSVLEIRALAGRFGAVRAEEACRSALERYPRSNELRHLHAALLIGLGREEEALRALRRLLYVDPSLIAAYLLRGSLLLRRGDSRGARMALRNARRLCLALPPEETIPLSEGETAGHLAQAAEAGLAALEPGEGRDAA